VLAGHEKRAAVSEYPDHDGSVQRLIDEGEDPDMNGEKVAYS
jgi:hypothetical protein